MNFLGFFLVPKLNFSPLLSSSRPPLLFPPLLPTLLPFFLLPFFPFHSNCQIVEVLTSIISGPQLPQILGGGDLVTGQGHCLSLSPSVFPSAFWASVSKDGGHIFSSDLQGLSRSVFYLVISSLFLHTWKIWLSLTSFWERLKALSVLATYNSHPAIPGHCSTGLASLALKSVESLWDLKCALHTSACLGVWWSTSQGLLTFSSPLHIFRIAP